MPLIDSWSPSGSTKLAGIVDAGECAPSVVASGLITEGVPNTNTPDGPRNAVALHPTPSPQAIYRASVTQTDYNQIYANRGVAIGFDSTGTNGVLAMANFNSFYTPSALIITKIGSTFTTRYQGPGGQVLAGNAAGVIECRITYTGTSYVYTLYEQGVAISGATWTDTGNVIGTPGRYWGAAFQPIINGAAPYYTPGMSNMQANYTSPVSPGQFFATF